MKLTLNKIAAPVGRRNHTRHTYYTDRASVQDLARHAMSLANERNRRDRLNDLNYLNGLNAFRTSEL